MTRKCIAVVLLARQERTRLVAEKLSSPNLEVIPALSSEDLFQQLNYHRVDLVIIENDLNGFFSGIEMLKRLYQPLWRPATVVLANRTAEIEVEAAGLGTNTILPPSSDATAILQAVHGVLADGLVAENSIPREACRIVDNCSQIRPLPQLLVKISQYLDIDNASIADFAQEISVDARVTADLLKLTNSTAMGLRSKFTSVFDAVNFLGVRRTASVVLSSALIDGQRQLQFDVPAGLRSWYNHRCVLVASTAATFARNLENVAPEQAQVLGLFQDLGILVLSMVYGERYTQLVDRVKQVPQLKLEYAERSSLRVNHAEVSAALLQQWGMPKSLVSLVLHHHDPVHGPDSGGDHGLLHVMRIGEAFADLMDNSAPQRLHGLNRLLGRYGRQKADLCRTTLKESAAAAIEAGRLFSLPVPDEAEWQLMVTELCEDGLDVTAGEIAWASGEDPLPEIELQTLCDASEPEPQPAAESQAMLETVADAGEKPLALIIDNDPGVAEVLESYLTSYGMRSETCDRCVTARQLAKDADIVFCDVHLGSESGLWIVETLRQDGYAGPIVVVSADSRRQTVERSIRAGITDYLVKPFTQAKVFQKLRQHVPAANSLARGPSAALPVSRSVSTTRQQAQANWPVAQSTVIG